MYKRIMAVIGALVLAGCVFVGALILSYRAEAIALDFSMGPPESLIEGQCEDPIVVIKTNRVMSMNESRALSVTARNGGSQPCRIGISLQAPDFNTSPGDTISTVEVAPGETTTTAWILSPKQPGAFDVAVEIDNSGYYQLGIRVTTILGLTAMEAKILSGIGNIMGPMLTAPWWYDKWQERKSKKKGKEAAGSNRESDTSKADSND